MEKKGNRNHQSRKAIRPLICFLILGCIILALLAIPVSAAKLTTPVIIHPPNNFRSYNSLGDILIAWKPVSGATSYYYELEEKSGSGWKHIESGSTPKIGFASRMMWYGSFRIRLYANNSIPAETSNPSAWRVFTIGFERKKLPAPVPVGPQSGITFYHTPRDIVLDWKPVLGANQYVVSIQYYDPIGNLWKPAPFTPVNVDTASHTGYTYTLPPAILAPANGRWSIVARDTAGLWQDSDQSPWRTFTFKN